jgi:hypothetical protein
MKIYETVGEWQYEGKRRFGSDFEEWKFVCPCCGRVTAVKEFKPFGAEPADAYQNCIGRFNGKGADGMKRGGKEVPANGCNWAAYGFLGTLDRGAVVRHDGKGIQVFDFAEKEGDIKNDML